ncbi:MAG: 3-methyl-2-oxobutanoate dehydrogenase (2-methylpropanoyl-transferring) subunit alpha, partial [Rhizorhabdus sp.]
MNGRNLPPLSLHIPEPAFRPGDEADYSAFEMPVAGVVARPEIDAHPATLRELPYEMIRVLDDDGVAQGPWNPRLAPETLLKILRSMALTRAFDDRLFRAHRQGKTSFYMK